MKWYDERLIYTFMFDQEIMHQPLFHTYWGVPNIVH